MWSTIYNNKVILEDILGFYVIPQICALIQLYDILNYIK